MTFSAASSTRIPGMARRNRGRLALVFLAAAFLALLGVRDAVAARLGGGGDDTLSSDIGNANNSANGALFDLTTKYLHALANQASAGHFTPGGFNPGGGGASDQPDPRWRLWTEGYSVWARTGAQNTFTGDRRTNYGGVAGLGYTLAPGVSVGASVDQGHTKIDLPVVAQSATVDLTQIGANGSIDSGPWTFSTAVIYGFGNIHANRSDGGGAISAAYDTWLFGAVNEVSYYWSSGNWRLVPKVGIDFTHIHNDAFAESGGTLPVSATAQVTNRARAFAGAEAGYSWFVDQTLYDISAYGRAVEIIHQSVDAVTLTALDGTSTPSVVPGVTDARFEFDAGASASVRLSNLTRLYAVYDGRFRDGFTAHAGTLGIEFRW